MKKISLYAVSSLVIGLSLLFSIIIGFSVLSSQYFLTTKFAFLFLILFIITFSTLLFLSWKIKGNLVPRCTLGGSGLLITIIALRSHSAVSLLLFGWLIIVTAALGKAVFRIVGKQQVQLTGVEKVSTYAGLGLGGLCYLVFIIGSLNILYSWVLYLSLGLLTVGLSREIIVIGKSIWKAIKTLLPRTDSGPSTLAKFTFSSLAVFFILIFI